MKSHSMTGALSRSSVGILGAGIMGCCLALELARRGCKVDLIERAPAPMTGASLHNEGKLHLGFVYANDPLKKTHGLMVRGSLSFARIIENLTGCNAADLAFSRPFHYFVPVDSHLDIAAIHHHFHEVENTIRDVSRSTGDSYLNLKSDCFFERNSSSDHESMFAPGVTLGSFRTEERSVSPITVAKALTRAVSNSPNVNFIGNTEVLSADRLACGDVELETRRNGETSTSRYSSVANCLWDDRLRLDRTAGIFDQDHWLLRYKATIIFTAAKYLPKNILSATGILGPYGDVVSHNDGSYYVSWYPLCKLVQTTDGDGRKLHDMVHKGVVSRCIKKMLSGTPSISKVVSSFAHKKFIQDNIREMAAYIPSMAYLVNNTMRCEVGGGVIMARGATDIDDPKSYLHQRSSIGPVAHGSYITIDTGKYCTAPLFALEAADMIMNVLQ
jgi:hypothetical protein